MKLKEVSHLRFLSTCLVFTFLMLVAPFLAQGQEVKAPNGICILTSKSGGAGLGFIIGSNLYSAAHVLEKADGKFLCVQDGRFVDVSDLKAGLAQLHPNYIDPMNLMKDWDPATRKQWLETRIRQVFDIGYVQLTTQLKSDFEIPLGTEADELQEGIVHFNSRRELVLEAAGPLAYAGEVRFHPERGLVEFAQSATWDIIADYSITTAPGDSGAPYVTIAPNGKLLVAGIVVGVQPETVLAPGLPHSSPTLAIHMSRFSRWLKADLSSLKDKDIDCDDLLN